MHENNSRDVQVSRRSGNTLRGIVVGWLFPLALCCGLFLVGGCRTFKREWANAEKTPVASRGILGRWEGTWSSEVNGHNGKLRCLVTLKDNGAYKARFHAIYRKVIGFGYTVPLGITETHGILEFRGKANLGWWAGGVYQYEGHVQGDDFFSTYRCKYDHGTFQMTRHK